MLNALTYTRVCVTISNTAAIRHNDRRHRLVPSAVCCDDVTVAGALCVEVTVVILLFSRVLCGAGWFTVMFNLSGVFKRVSFK